jgi:translocation and assembly module TamB
MSRNKRLLRNVAIGLLGFIVVVVASAIIIVQTDWFRNYVRQKIIASTEAGTGGTVEVGTFGFDWRHLRAVVADFVIHGNEPAGSAPFVRAPRVQVDIRLFTSIHHLIDVAFLAIQNPQVNVIVFADGRTNIPTPKQKSTSNTTSLESVMDLAVDHFDLSNGLLVFESQKQVLNIRGSNLRAELWYNVLKQDYSGQLTFQPVYVASGRNTPVILTVKLPVALQRDRIDFHDASITTPQTRLLINGSVENMRNPRVSAHINGHLALADLRNAANLPLAVESHNVPTAVDLDANATVADNTIQVAGLRMGIGSSDIEASGTLKDPRGNGSLEFKSRLALGELGRLAKVSARPEGTVVLNGTLKLDLNNNYDVNGNIQAKNVSFVEGAQRFSNLDLESALHFDPCNLNMKGLRLVAFGGQFAGDVDLQDFERYQVRGKLRDLNVRNAARAFGEKQFAYDGSLSGPIEAAGDLKSTPVTRSMTAHAQLSITPGRQGIPMSGRLFADYNGATDNLRVENSFITLPHTRLNLNGSIGNQLNVSLVTSDVNDLLAGTSMKGKSPVNLNDRQATFTGTVTGKLDAPRVAGHLALNRFSIEGRQFDSLTADAAASSSGASIQNGLLARGPMQTQFSGHVGLKNWSPTPNQPLSADATIQNGDLADMLALAGQNSADYSGALGATLHLTGTVGNPSGSANIQATNGTILGEPFDRAQAQVNLAEQSVTIPAAFVQSGASRVNLTGEYRHPRDTLATGVLHAHVQSNTVDLAQLRNLQKQRSNTAGLLQVNLDVNGKLSEAKIAGKIETEFLLTAVNGDASARGLRFEGKNYGDISANARTSGQNVAYNVVSDFAGSNVHVTGNTQLIRDYPTTADATIRNLPVESVLAVTQRKDIPAKGNLSGALHFSGTMQHPQGTANVDLSNAVLYDEPIDHIRTNLSYLAKTVDVKQLEIAAGPARIEASGRFDHPEGNFESGNLQFQVNSSGVDLARIHNVQTRRPGLGGVLKLAANGNAEVRQADPRVIFQDLTADIAAQRIAAQGKNYGDLTLNAKTQGGKVNFVLASNLANSSIQGTGSAQFIDHYPVDAQVTFNNVSWTRLRGLLGPESTEPLNVEVLTDGQIAIHGPVSKTEELRGSAQLSKLQVSSIPAARSTKPVTLVNQGPISASFDHQIVRIDNAHLTGPQTDLQAKGTVSLKDQSMDLTLSANANLALLQDFDRDFTSSGSVVMATAVRGTFTNPLLNGKMELKNGSVNYADLPNGISNANGVILLNGNTASVRNLTAESGGGTLALNGFATLSGNNPRFGLRTNASSVRVRVQQGASIVADGAISLSGTKDGSQLSGTATINRIAYAPQTDVGSMLTRAAPPIQAPSTPSPLLDNMKLDIRVRTSDALSVQTALAESLQAQADLHIRGTASHPGVLGRVNITEGTMTFFSSKYTVNSGTIAFYNPVRIEPILDINLQTNAKGVDVTLRVTGPIDNMKLSYSSDPPLQFQEIVSLLAGGKTPTSDPTLLARQPAQPPQTFQQMGESALVSKALADPVSGRLQRVFGVSQLKIDPTFTSGSQLPQAQMTLQQQIASNLTFTYVTALDNPNATTIRVDLTLNPQWSAQATRDQNGIFSVNLMYKRQMR